MRACSATLLRVWLPARKCTVTTLPWCGFGPGVIVGQVNCFTSHINVNIPLAKPNYSFEKRQRELASKKKQEEKDARKKAAREQAKAENAPADDNAGDEQATQD